MANRDLKVTLESILDEQIIENIPKTGIIHTRLGKEYFLKSGIPSQSYLCEANGLKELAKTNIIEVAEVISVGEDYILTQYIAQGNKPNNFFENFGRKFAQLHQFHGQQFGFYEDNFIGMNPQWNIPTAEEKNNWIVFYFNKRLLYQYKLAEKNNYISSSLRANFIKLESKIEQILKTNDQNIPSLLHSDLWAGNFLCNKNGNPVLIDPAVYYGHREADLAITKVFGGFSSSFYDAYIKEYPLEKGWQYRENIYKLYHLLNHLNLFGKSYLAEVEYIVKKYVKDC